MQVPKLTTEDTRSVIISRASTKGPFLVTTQNMVADVMTKATDKGTFMKMRGWIMNNHVGLREAMHKGVMCMGWNAQQAMSRIANHL